MNTTDIRKQIYEIIEQYAPDCSEPKKLCSSIEDIVDDLAETKVKNLGIFGVMPRRLTAENGAKGLLIGEFHETIVCYDDEGEPYEVKMPVEWDTIKQIYAKIVDYYGA